MTPRFTQGKLKADSGVPASSADPQNDGGEKALGSDFILKDLSSCDLG